MRIKPSSIQTFLEMALGERRKVHSFIPNYIYETNTIVVHTLIEDKEISNEYLNIEMHFRHESITTNYESYNRKLADELDRVWALTIFINDYTNDWIPSLIKCPEFSSINLSGSSRDLNDRNFEYLPSTSIHKVLQSEGRRVGWFGSALSDIVFKTLELRSDQKSPEVLEQGINPRWVYMRKYLAAVRSDNTATINAGDLYIPFRQKDEAETLSDKVEGVRILQRKRKETGGKPGHYEYVNVPVTNYAKDGYKIAIKHRYKQGCQVE